MSMTALVPNRVSASPVELVVGAVLDRQSRARWWATACASRGRSRLLSHLASDEAFSGPGIDDAPGIDLLTLSFVAVVDAIPLDDRRVAI